MPEPPTRKELSTATDLPLAETTVISVEQAVAAPLATRHLSDLGARVIKIERPSTGDFSRGYDQVVEGLSSHFVWLNRGKESVELDLRSEAGRRALDGLVRNADVFVCNLGPDVISRLGIGAETLHQRYPGLIACEISGYGTPGPYAERKAYDLLIQCEAGLLSLTGTPDVPSRAGISVADIAGGMYALSSILAALVRRQRGGGGAVITTSLLECLAEWMGAPLYHALYSESAPPRTGPHHPTIAPYGPFPTSEGRFVFIAVQNDAEWRQLCDDVLELPGMTIDPRFATNPARVLNRGPLESTISERFIAMSERELLGRLSAARIAHTFLRSVAELAKHPQLAARRALGSVPSSVGQVFALRPPFNISGAESPMGAIPRLGEHSARVLREFGVEMPTDPADEGKE